MVRVYVPATIGNVGPGFDVLGLAVDGLGDTFELEFSEQDSIQIEGRDANLIPIASKENTVTIAAHHFLKAYGQDAPLRVQIDRSLPSSGGLGSSAASSVAGALAAAHLIGQGGQKEQIIASALEAETLVAGRHLDNIAPCLLGGLCMVESAVPARIRSLPIHESLGLHLLLLTPKIKINTKDARSCLPQSVSQSEMVEQLARLSALLGGFSNGDLSLLASGLSDSYNERYRQSLIPNFREAQGLAIEAGALAYTISGAGPTCFALFADKEAAHKCQEILLKLYDQDATVHIGGICQRGARIL